MEQLVLERLRACADDGFAAAQQCRQQVGEGLARARPGLDDQAIRALDRLGDSLSHPGLAGTRLEPREMGFQRAVFAEKFGQVGHGARVHGSGKTRAPVSGWKLNLSSNAKITGFLVLLLFRLQV